MWVPLIFQLIVKGEVCQQFDLFFLEGENSKYLIRKGVQILNGMAHCGKRNTNLFLQNVSCKITIKFSSFQTPKCSTLST